MQGKSYLILLYCLLTTGARAQETFVRHFPHPQRDYHAINGMAVLASGDYALITDDQYYRINNRGQQLAHQSIRSGRSSYLNALLPMPDGRLRVAQRVFLDNNDSELHLLTMDASGQVQEDRLISTDALTSYEQLLPGTQDRFYITCRYTSPEGISRLHIQFRNSQGVEIWRMQVPNELPSTFQVKSDDNGGLELFFTDSKQQAWLLSIDETGLIREQALNISLDPQSYLYLPRFARAGDGGYLLAGTDNQPLDKKDIGLRKVDAQGRQQWEARIDVFQGDVLADLQALPDGYLLLINSGRTEVDWLLNRGREIVLMKTDLQGKPLWRKALGSNNQDNPRGLLVINPRTILVAGSIYDPTTLSVTPSLFQLNGTGELTTDPFPHTLQPPDSFQWLQPEPAAAVHKMTKAIPDAAGGWLAGFQVLHTDDELLYPYLLHTAASGQPVWSKRVLEYPGSVVSLKPTPDGHYIVLTETVLSGGQIHNLIKFTPAGDSVWAYTFFSGAIRDVQPTRDGGYLVTGQERGPGGSSALDLVLLKINARGQQVWKKLFGQTGLWERGHIILETPEKEYIIAGFSQQSQDILSTVYLLKVDANGQQRWSRTYPAAMATNAPYGMLITPNGDYLLAGFSAAAYGPRRDLLLMRTDKNGNLLWEQQYNLHELDGAVSLVSTGNGRYMVTGTAGEPVAGRREKFVFLMSIDESGKQLGVTYYGIPGQLSTITNIFPLISRQLLLTGSAQEVYGEEKLFSITVNSDIVLPPPPDPPAPGIRLYPVPARYFTRLVITHPYTGSVQVRVTDNLGRTKKQLVYQKQTESWTQEIPVADLAVGLYYVEIKMGEERVVKKLVVGR
ncbi:MAG: T9SS type A sorting domain-containing protein [Candidatus Pseudobacter hemicellulosilyticus]|uniref:T9SS type A sorting domain-containing protein n=1 Tax=Candidatus Pseudobacter hemicellulosilyticus TaxID=3121375 RepID=A0AAJ6BFE6_9BACT|nr:MAG: T9SS type A sorting domain-containing protein [Pseudobacter sp.]